MKSLIGAAWEEEAKGSGRTWYRLALDLGFLPALSVRVVENTKQEKERSPSHVILYTSMDGQDVRIGALWPYTNGEGASYLIGHVDVAAFGEVGLKGGARVDFRLAGERIGVRLSAVQDRKSEKSPTHQLWRMRPISKKTAEATAAAGAETADGEPEASEEEELAPEAVEDRA